MLILVCTFIGMCLTCYLYLIPLTSINAFDYVKFIVSIMIILSSVLSCLVPNIMSAYLWLVSCTPEPRTCCRGPMIQNALQTWGLLILRVSDLCTNAVKHYSSCHCTADETIYLACNLPKRSYRHIWWVLHTSYHNHAVNCAMFQCYLKSHCCACCKHRCTTNRLRSATQGVSKLNITPWLYGNRNAYNSLVRWVVKTLCGAKE